MRVDATGKAQLVTGASPHGQGTATALAQIVADELGLTPDDVAVRHGDMAMIPFGVGTYASRNAVVAGSAALVAAQAVAAKARRLAAHLLEVDAADLELVAGAVRVRGAPHRQLALGQLARAAAPGQPLPAGMDPGLEATHYFAAPRPTFASGLHVAVVDVERETGRIAIVDYAIANDAGRLINPLIVEGQIHGGVAQGVGGALYEELAYDEDGQPRAQSLLDYALPNAEQVPGDADRPSGDAQRAEPARGQGRRRSRCPGAARRHRRRRRGRAAPLRRAHHQHASPAGRRPAPGWRPARVPARRPTGERRTAALTLREGPC